MQTQCTAVLDVQSRIAHEVERCEAVLTQIDDAQKMAVSGILEKDRPPVQVKRLDAKKKMK